MISVRASLLVLSGAGCVIPTAYGIRDDGLLPPPGGTELTAHAGIGPMAMDLSGSGRTIAGGASAQGRWRLSEDLGLRVNSALVHASGMNGNVLSAEGDILVAALSEPRDPLTLTFSGGPSLVGNIDDVFLGLQGGATLSRTLAGQFHPYAGVRLNPVFALSSALPAAWLSGGAGLSWRPTIRDRAVVLGIEAARYQGWDVCLAFQGEVFGEFHVTPYDCGSWSLGLYAGLTLPHRR